MIIIYSAKINQAIQTDLVQSFKEASFYFFSNIEEAEQLLPEAEILITYGEDLQEKQIQSAKQLKWIMVISAGLDQMPFQAIKERGILVTNCRGIHAKPMAEYTIGMMLQVARQSKQLIKNEEQHLWDRTVPMLELNEKCLVILGTGAIGQEIARLAQAFQMQVYGLNTSGKSVSHFDRCVPLSNVAAILSEADYVVNVLPLTEQTNNLLNKDMFLNMKKESVFINIGRGGTVNESDLLTILQQGLIKHAVLDVVSQEPLPPEHELWEMENVTVTPHLSGISSFYQPRAFEIFKQNLEKYLEEDTNESFLNRIDLDQGY
ncbi:D-2-hydroxyacid dehydrogenase [Alkalihalobacillus pseudalcaliphilus]|uniref:D-2-hydroxyacid dehydrogenase n=1 Tax=Alkalihalobacillus pseudalcaliphilus TaxID=79884 RepID=UPI00064DA9D1|nr:D-2-hydroxyacid dehydrogenase [Alkalihalobacillus pseudalcaliphilus]KMK74926.1 3-phosphoglycerate dehydrogenase [Alkalihalobacillus pseudalcaliphilus]